MDLFCYYFFVVVVLSCLLNAALWSPAGERANLLAFLCLEICCVLSLSSVVSCVGCGTLLF